MDRAYAMNLAMIRKAAQLTQVEVAKRLGVGQAAVSRMENRGDMPLSTLYDYLTATGADAASIVVVVHGRRIDLDLGSLRAHPETATPCHPADIPQVARPTPHRTIRVAPRRSSGRR